VRFAGRILSASRLVTVLGASLLIVRPPILEKPLKIGRAFPHVSVAGRWLVATSGPGYKGL
jgi:hypothetical protein